MKTTGFISYPPNVLGLQDAEKARLLELLDDVVGNLPRRFNLVGAGANPGTIAEARATSSSGVGNGRFALVFCLEEQQRSWIALLKLACQWDSALAGEGAVEIDERLTAAFAKQDIEYIADENVVRARLDVFSDEAFKADQARQRAAAHPRCLSATGPHRTSVPAGTVRRQSAGRATPHRRQGRWHAEHSRGRDDIVRPDRAVDADQKPRRIGVTEETAVASGRPNPPGPAPAPLT